LDDQDFVGVPLAREALVGEVFQQVCTLFAPNGSAILDYSLLDGAVGLHVRCILDEQVSHQHEVLGDSPAGLRGQRRRQRIGFETLVEVVLPQKRFEHILLLVVVILGDHRLPS